MKKIVLILTALSLIIYSCSENDSDTKEDEAQQQQNDTPKEETSKEDVKEEEVKEEEVKEEEVKEEEVKEEEVIEEEVIEEEVIEEEVINEGLTIWKGPKTTFTKATETDPTLETNQDRITDKVWITRGNDGGQIYNAVSETISNKSASPKGTEWVFGTTAMDLKALTFEPFRAAVGSPKAVVGKDYVLHLIEEDIYIDVKFISWSEGKADGKGGFSYERSTKE